MVLRVQPIDVYVLLTSSSHVHASIYELSIFSGAVAEAAVVDAGVAVVVVRAAA
jgi:hypothetical protein